MAKRNNINKRTKPKVRQTTTNQPKASLVKKENITGSGKQNIEYAFVALLVGYLITDILPNWGYTSLLSRFVWLNYTWLGMIGVSSLLLIWTNRHQLSKPKTEGKSPEAFSSTFPKLAKTPLIGRVSRYLYDQGVWVNLGLLCLLVVAGIVYFYKLGYYNWLPDEPLVMKAARGYLESGQFYLWDYWTNTLSENPYPRAWPHTWLVAQAINIFGSSETIARMVSAIFGLATIPILYFVSHSILRNKLAALIITACLIFHPYTVHYFRRVRMYAVLIPIFILLFYYCYQAITARKTYSNAIYNRWPAFNKYLNFQWGFILLAIMLLYLNYEVQRISLVILPAFFIFYLYLLITKREKRLIVLLLVALIPSVYIILQEDVWGSFTEKISRSSVYNPLYWEYLFKYPVTIGLSLLMVSLSLVWSVLSKQRDQLVAVQALTIAGIVLYIFVIEFNDHYRYVIHLIPFCLILSIGMMIKINSLLSKTWLKTILPVFILLAAISEYSNQFERVYYDNIEAQFPKQAYPTIINNINPESEAIVGLFFADYYLAGLGDQIDLIEMDRRQAYTISKFRSDSRKYESMWVTWATRKSYHINKEFYQYLAGNCVKYHGYGIDNTLTEVFYCQNQ